MADYVHNPQMGHKIAHHSHLMDKAKISSSKFMFESHIPPSLWGIPHHGKNVGIRRRGHHYYHMLEDCATTHNNC